MPEFLTVEEVIELHDDQIARFGGRAGLRDRGLLESALAQPGLAAFGQLAHPDLADQAAAYLYHLARNHAFADANKRTAVASMLVFLQLNDAHCRLSDPDLFDLVLDVAQGHVDKEQLAERLTLTIQSRQERGHEAP